MNYFEATRMIETRNTTRFETFETDPFRLSLQRIIKKNLQSTKDQLLITKDQGNQAGKCKRAIIWFNLPYSMNVKTNIGITFFKLLQKHFPPTHPMYTIFNKNKIKISYSCFPNMGSIIS